MRRIIRSTVCLSFAVAMVCVLVPSARAATAANLVGNWSGSWTDPLGPFLVFNFTFTVDSAGNINFSNGQFNGDTTASGQIQVDPKTGQITGSFSATTVTYTFQSDAKIVSPGNNGQPFRITGTVKGVYTFGGFTLDVIDASGGTLNPPVFKSAAAVDGEVGTALNFQVVVTGDDPLTLQASGLPSGVNLTNSTLLGMPDTAGDYSVTLTAKNPVGTTVQILLVHIRPPEPPALASAGQIVNLVVGQPFSVALQASGAQPVLFSVGALPPGVTLNLGYRLEGQIDTAGSYSVAVTATNAGGAAQGTVVFAVTPMDPNADYNGDGVPSAVAVLLGLNPFDPAQTPFAGKPSNASRLMSFKRASLNRKGDTLTISGTIMVDQSFSRASNASVLLGAFAKTLQLSNSGMGTASANGVTVTLRVGGKSHGITTQNAPFSVQFKGSGLSAIKAANPDGAPLYFLLDQAVYSATVKF